MSTAFAPLIAPLFVPADRPDRFEKAARSGADAIIVDLEDAVAPGRKDDGRDALSGLGDLATPVFVRINASGTPWYEADVAALRRHGIGLVVLPKVETGEALDRLADELGDAVTILAQIETATGAANIAAIARHRSVVQLAFGPADFFLDMVMAASPEMIAQVLCQLAVASRAAGIAKPLDGPAFDIRDGLATLPEQCGWAARCGAGGKLCIHPTQVPVVRRTFAPSQNELDWARRVIEADRDGAAQVVDGRMIDAPVVAQARAVLSRAV